MTEQKERMNEYRNEKEQQEREMEAQREKWRTEVAELRAEENKHYGNFEKKCLPFCAAAVLCCFLAYLIWGGNFERVAGRGSFYGIWFGSLIVMLHYSIKLDGKLDKFCIGLLLCTAGVIGFMLLSLTSWELFRECLLISKLFALAGVALSIYPIWYLWTHKAQIEQTETSNPWAE